MLYKNNELTEKFLSDCAEIISMLYVKQCKSDLPEVTTIGIGNDVAKELITEFTTNIKNNSCHSDDLENLMDNVIRLLKNPVKSLVTTAVN